MVYGLDENLYYYLDLLVYFNSGTTYFNVTNLYELIVIEKSEGYFGDSSLLLAHKIFNHRSEFIVCTPNSLLKTITQSAYSFFEQFIFVNHIND